MKKLYSLLILMTLTVSLFAQNRTISGKVTDAGGLGLPGVTVQLVGTQTGTVSDVQGNFRLSVSDGILRFSYIGFVAQDIKIGAQSVINVVLIEQAQTLNEVVVVGYGTQKKKDLTTAVSVVGEKELKDRPPWPRRAAAEVRHRRKRQYSRGRDPGACGRASGRGRHRRDPLDRPVAFGLRARR